MTAITKFDHQKYDLDTLNRMAEIAVRSGKYPGFDHATVMNIFFSARALDVDPFLALNSGYSVINGKLNMGAHFMVALARRAGHSLKVIELTKEKCVIIGQRKDNGDSIKYEYTIEEAQEAELTHKKNWKTNRKSMLYCACARNLFRMLFCDIAIPYDADEMNTEVALQEVDNGLKIKSIPGEAISVPCLSHKVDSSPNEGHSAQNPSSPIEELKNRLAKDGMPIDKLSGWLKMRAEMKNETEDTIAKFCLDEKFLPKFKEAFATFIAPESSEALAV